jgi:hypothetical protein
LAPPGEFPKHAAKRLGRLRGSRIFWYIRPIF